jgi:hypothetical protein
VAALAGDRIDGFREALRASVTELGALLDAGQARSDAWFEFGKRLSAECKRLGSATYCLSEWAEPDDARAALSSSCKMGFGPGGISRRGGA